MIKTILLFIILCNFCFAKTIHDFKAKDIKGYEISLSKFKGKNILIVNVASKCGYTYQYEGLEKLYSKYKTQNFEIIAFPANNFGSQEPGSNEEIAKFCKFTYNTSFTLMSKISVSGKDKHELFKFLTEENMPKSEIQWNFEKFLVDKNGLLVAKYPSSVEPMNDSILKKIDSLK